MQISSVFKAASFSLLAAGAISFSACSSGNQISYSRCFYDLATSKSTLPDFSARLFCAPDSGRERLDIYVSVDESALRLSKEESSYFGGYIANLHIYRGEEEVDDREISRSVRRNAYPGSTEKAYDAFLASFYPDSGNYTVQIDVSDSLARGTATRKYDVTVPPYSSHRNGLSDILLLARFDTTGGSHRITPFILSNAGLLPDTIKFFTVVSSVRPTSDSISFSLYRLQNRKTASQFNALMVYTAVPSSYDPCDDIVDTMIVYRYWISANLAKGNSYLFGMVPKPPEGDYLLTVSAFDSARIFGSSSLQFRVRNQNFPDLSGDLNEMVGAVNYIAAGPEMKRIVAVESDSAIRANLVDFWKEHGGLEKMVQYYRRVAQANRYFTSCIEGWRTPMGMFYIVCGSPDAVDCDGEWGERWTYSQSSGQNALIVVFRLIRETLNAEDRLYRIENIYSNSDMLNYFVTKWRTPD